MPKLRWSERLNRKLVYIGLRRMTQRQLDTTFIDISERFFQNSGYRRGLPTLIGSLSNLKSQGFLPSHIFDIGANRGQWTREAASVFPQARFVLVEANAKHAEILNQTVNALEGHASFEIRLLGPEIREEATFYTVDVDNQIWQAGSSVLPELTTYPKEAVTLPMDTLDNLLSRYSYLPPVLLKLDVQGYELEVLKGGPEALHASEVVILETPTLPYNPGSPLIDEVIAFMKSSGFAVYDICGQRRRETDAVLFHVDLIFTKESSALRQAKRFWSGEP
jgi:FkbM family methyltransferase